MSPLPTEPKQLWPPASVPQLDFAIWDEWYSGSFGTNVEHATPPSTGGAMERLTGGFVHRHETQGRSVSKSQPVHCPLAADIAQTSADLLFSDMPDLRFSEDKAQKRLEELADAMGLQNALLEAAETCAALGGGYLRVSWDTEVADHPFITHVDADRAVPEFRYGRLMAVTFWREVAREGERVYRHLERHEKGLILHGLYAGDRTHLGTSIDLGAVPETKGLTPELHVPDTRSRLLAWYVPNVRPNQRDRRSYLGRSDIAGAEPFLDSLDETWSGLMRDVRLGQSRILIPTGTLESNDPGQRGAGKHFDLDREVFTEIDVPAEGMQPTMVQPEIRTDKYLAIAVAKVREIVSKAGYSPQTFGLDIDGQAESGTALRIREEKTWRTLGRKRRYWEGELRLALTALLEVDAAEFKGSARPSELPTVEWQEEATGLGEMSRIMLDLRNAETASIETRVRMVNPTWDEEKVTAEVERIRDEIGSVVPEPAF